VEPQAEGGAACMKKENIEIISFILPEYNGMKLKTNSKRNYTVTE
jgi:hypothetical protein